MTDLLDIIIDDNSTAQIQTFNDCDYDVDFKLINGGRIWPSVVLTFIEPTLGDTNEASVERWIFFSEYELCE